MFKEGLSAIQIEKALYDEYKKRGCKYFSSNSYKGTGFESDFVVINQSKFLIEFEIKRSYGDFLSDLRNKVDKHQKLEGGYLSNYFYFVSEPGIIPLNKVPKYCGLIEVYESGNKILARTVRIAPSLHSNIITLEKIVELQTTIINKYYKQIR